MGKDLVKKKRKKVALWARQNSSPGDAYSQNYDDNTGSCFPWGQVRQSDRSWSIMACWFDVKSVCSRQPCDFKVSRLDCAVSVRCDCNSVYSQKAWRSGEAFSIRRNETRDELSPIFFFLLLPPSCNICLFISLPAWLPVCLSAFSSVRPSVSVFMPLSLSLFAGHQTQRLKSSLQRIWSY